MGKPTGFLELGRELPPKVSVEERLNRLVTSFLNSMMRFTVKVG